MEINWTYYSSLPKSVLGVSWILKLKRNWLKWERGEKDRKFYKTKYQRHKQWYRNINKNYTTSVITIGGVELVNYHKEVLTAIAKFYRCFHLLMKRIYYVLVDG